MPTIVWLLLSAAYVVSQSLLDANTIPQFVDELLIPPAMPETDRNYYEIAARQFTQQILPLSAGFPATTVWGYGSVNHPNTFSYPAFTIEAQVNKTVRVKWINDLVDARRNHLTHLFKIDQTLNWANPANPDRAGTSLGQYTGPIPLVVHVHGASTTDDSDGHPWSWFLPDARNIPANYARNGTYYDRFRRTAEKGDKWRAGSVVFTYPMRQPPATLWYHDHTYGITRLNVMAGLVGFFLVRNPANVRLGLPGGDRPFDTPLNIESNSNMDRDYSSGDNKRRVQRPYEIPILIQDRSFYDNGSFYYPERNVVEGLDLPFVGSTACDGKPSDVNPSWIPEFFGDVMVVNGRTWPRLSIEPRRYRFRILNGCNARFLILNIPGYKFDIIGTEAGFLSNPVRMEHLYVGPAERFDVIVDFSSAAVGTTIEMRNLGPDEPYGGEPLQDVTPANPATTGKVLRFHVVLPLLGRDTSTPARLLNLTATAPIPYTSAHLANPRQVTLREKSSQTVRVDANNQLDCAAGEPFGPVLGLLGDASTRELMFRDPPTEVVQLNTIEVWEVINYTPDAHPIHIHQFPFQVINRQGLAPTDPVIPRFAWETDYKDTFIANPGTITRLAVRFTTNGTYLWHCHILEHEDNEMMRPLVIVGARSKWWDD